MGSDPEVAHGQGPQRTIQTSVSPVEVRRAKVRDRGEVGALGYRPAQRLPDDRREGVVVERPFDAIDGAGVHRLSANPEMPTIDTSRQSSLLTPGARMRAPFRSGKQRAVCAAPA
jgi:hypothetical protein